MFAFLRSRSLRQGFLRGGRLWSAVGVVVWGARLLRRVLERRPETVATEKLRPGRTVVVTALERTGRRS